MGGLSSVGVQPVPVIATRPTSGLTGAPITLQSTQAEPARAANSDGAPLASVSAESTAIGAAAACSSAGTVCAHIAWVGVRVDDGAAATTTAGASAARPLETEVGEVSDVDRGTAGASGSGGTRGGKGASASSASAARGRA